MKRGQVTIFVIIGIVIALVGGGIYFLTRGESSASDVESADVHSFVESCLEKTSEEGILLVAKNGGYYYPGLVDSIDNVPIYFNQGKFNIPEKENIENELSLYIEFNLFSCFDNFTIFPNKEISIGEIEVDTKINFEDVSFELFLPVSIIKGDSVSTINSFTYTSESRFGEFFEYVMEFEKNDTIYDGLCLNCINDIIKDKEIYLSINDSINGTIFNLEDKSSEHINLIYRFANKYLDKEYEE